MSKRPTIQMVADHAGVSRGTVDRVLHGRSYVREDVRKRVLAAVKTLGYLSPQKAFRQNFDERSDARPIRLGVLLPNWDGLFYSEISRGIAQARESLAARHTEIQVVRCKTDLPDEAVQRLDTLVAWGAQGIALCAVNDFVIESRVRMLSEQEIPCITFNSDLPQSPRLCFVGQDYVKSGRIAAELLYKCLPSNGRILAMAGNLEYHGHRARLDGFCARMRELGFPTEQIEVAETHNDYWATYHKVQRALQSCTDLAAVYMVNRSVAGCTDAIAQAGRTGQLRVVAHDLSDQTKQMLADGRLDFAITQDMYRQGYQPLMLLDDLLRRGKMPETSQCSTQISIICSQNME